LILELVPHGQRWEAQRRPAPQCASKRCRAALTQRSLGCCWPFPYLLRLRQEVSPCAGVNHLLVALAASWRQRLAGLALAGRQRSWPAAGGRSDRGALEDPRRNSQQPLNLWQAGIHAPAGDPGLHLPAGNRPAGIAASQRDRPALARVPASPARRHGGANLAWTDGSAAKAGSCRWGQVTPE